METLKKVGKWAGIAIAVLVIVWAAYHVLFTSVADAQAYESQPAWMHYLPDFIRKMILDVQKLF